MASIDFHGPKWLIIGLLVVVPLAWGLGVAYLFDWIRHVRAKKKEAAEQAALEAEESD